LAAIMGKTSTTNKKLDRKLYDAVKTGNVEHVRQFLDQGAQPNSPVGKKGMTAMERAAGGSNREIEQLLFASGGELHRTSTLSE
jgi:ankyrin repeat protein